MSELSSTTQVPSTTIRSHGTCAPAPSLTTSPGTTSLESTSTHVPALAPHAHEAVDVRDLGDRHLRPVDQEHRDGPREQHDDRHDDGHEQVGEPVPEDVLDQLVDVEHREPLVDDELAQGRRLEGAGVLADDRLAARDLGVRQAAGVGDGVEVGRGGPDRQPGPADAPRDVVRDEADPLEHEVAVGDVVLLPPGRERRRQKRRQEREKQARRRRAAAAAASSRPLERRPILSRLIRKGLTTLPDNSPEGAGALMGAGTPPFLAPAPPPTLPSSAERTAASLASSCALTPGGAPPTTSTVLKWPLCDSGVSACFILRNTATTGDA